MRFTQILLAAALIAVSPGLFAEKPDPVDNPPLQVREQNLDLTTQAIRVREQGIVEVDILDSEELDVNVTGGQIDANVTNSTLSVEGTVSVDSLPDLWVGGGNLTPVSRAYFDVLNIGAGGNYEYTFTEGPILATLLYVSDSDDEVGVTFYSDSLASGGGILVILDRYGDAPDHTISLTYPMEVSGLKVNCYNSSDTCSVSVTIIGFPS